MVGKIDRRKDPGKMWTSDCTQIKIMRNARSNQVTEHRKNIIVTATNQV